MKFVLNILKAFLINFCFIGIIFANVSCPSISPASAEDSPSHQVEAIISDVVCSFRDLNSEGNGAFSSTLSLTKKKIIPFVDLEYATELALGQYWSQLEPRDILIPDIDEDSAILELEACGICGSDVEQYEGVISVELPLIPGHEPLGRIARIGDRAAARWRVDVGDRVAVETMLSCRFCSCCLGGQYHLCRDRKIYSYIPLSEQPGLWGAYSQYMYLHPNSIVHKMDPNLPAETAVMFNPLGAGYRWAVELPQTRPGDKVVILGPGQRGLACVIAAKEAGAGQVIVTGLEADKPKLELALEFGADHCIDVDNENSVNRYYDLAQYLSTQLS